MNRRLLRLKPSIPSLQIPYGRHTEPESVLAKLKSSSWEFPLP